MISAPAGVRIVVATAPVDGRKGMDSLAAMVQQAMRDNPFSGDLFIFRTKRADRIKMVVWDGSGLWLHQKRLALRQAQGQALHLAADQGRGHHPQSGPIGDAFRGTGVVARGSNEDENTITGRLMSYFLAFSFGTNTIAL